MLDTANDLRNPEFAIGCNSRTFYGSIFGCYALNKERPRTSEKCMRNKPSFSARVWPLRSARHASSRLQHCWRRASEKGGLGTLCNCSRNQLPERKFHITTYTEERTLLGFFLDDEKTVKSHPVENGHDPVVFFGNGPVADERRKLVNNPRPS